MLITPTLAGGCCARAPRVRHNKPNADMKLLLLTIYFLSVIPFIVTQAERTGTAAD
jgi:hypothetical protein